MLYHFISQLQYGEDNWPSKRTESTLQENNMALGARRRREPLPRRPPPTSLHGSTRVACMALTQALKSITVSLRRTALLHSRSGGTQLGPGGLERWQPGCGIDAGNWGTDAVQSVTTGRQNARRYVTKPNLISKEWRTKSKWSLLTVPTAMCSECLDGILFRETEIELFTAKLNERSLISFLDIVFYSSLTKGCQNNDWMEFIKSSIKFSVCIVSNHWLARYSRIEKTGTPSLFVGPNFKQSMV